MTSEIFLKCLEHFVHYSSASKINKKHLLLNGQNSQKSLAVLEYAKENGIALFGFSAYCTHSVQPLDVGFFGPLQIYYDQEIQSWLRQHPGRVVTHFQVAGLLNNAYLKSATSANSVHAFAKTGIYPFDPNIFEDWLFAPSLSTEKGEQANSKYKIQEFERQTHLKTSSPHIRSFYLHCCFNARAKI